MTWRDEVASALQKLNGQGTLTEIYEKVAELKEADISKSFTASIRDALERNSSDSVKFNGKNDVFYCVHGKGQGIWGLRIFEVNENSIDLTQDDSSFSEGRKLLRKHICRERNHALIVKAKEKFKEEHDGKIYCEVCDFDFFVNYGELGEGFIEAHHTKAVSEMAEGERTDVKDIAMVCSNCHSMLHRRKPWLNRDELKKIMAYQLAIDEEGH